MRKLWWLRYNRYSVSRFKNNNWNSFFLFSTSNGGQTGHTANRVQLGPPPIRVAITESAGRGVFATRRIGAGEIIHSAKPILCHPSLSAICNVCYFCLRKVKNSSSDQPRWVSFCCEDCEEQAKVLLSSKYKNDIDEFRISAFYGIEIKSDWLAYDEYCRSRGLKYPLLIKRFACMVISGAVSYDLLDILQPSSLSSQMVSEMEEGFDLLKSAFKESNVPDEKMTFMTKQWYIGSLARIRINAFRIELVGGLYEDLFSAAAASIEAEAAVGNALYMLPSFYNHDCDPNAHIVWIDNVDARLMALRDVEEGEELRICYIDASMNHDSRKTFLSQGFGFQCKCLRCSSGD